MKVLTQEQKDAITKTLDPFLKNRKAEAICVYGSQIAGYSSEKSDYDVIVVLNGFRQKIKYYYLRGATQCSALAVDSKSFEADCRKSSLGEFVSGRLLNCFEVLKGEEWITRNELQFKKRIILEGLNDVYAEHQRFAIFVRFALAYFLFEKLRKRVAIYPPVAYSYSMTYGQKLRDRNVADSLDGFRRAAHELSLEGILTLDERNDKVQLVPGKFEVGLTSKISSRASYTAKSLAQYAVHGYAGRVGVDVIGREVASKISRSRKKFNLPDEIRNPEEFWSIEEGRLYPDTEDWHSDLLECLGVEKASIISQKSMGEFYNSAKAMTIDNGARKMTVAVKKYTDVKSMKWIIVNLWSLKNTNFSLSPIERLTREYGALCDFKKLGVRTPAIIALFLSERILVTEYITGKNLSDIESNFLENGSEDLRPVRLFGEALARIHNCGFCMGDSKPSNAIMSDSSNEIYLVDLEQVHPSGNVVWDVAEFIYYSTMFTLKEDRARKIVDAFVSGYQSKTTNPTIVKSAAALRYRAPFQPFIAPNLVNSLRKDLSLS